MQTVDFASLPPVTPKLALRWNEVGGSTAIEGEAIAVDPVRRAGVLAPGSGRPGWIHVDLPNRAARERRSADAAWDPLAAPLHEAGVLAAPELDLATLATLRSLSDLGPRSAAQHVLALQVLRRDSPRLGELLGVRIVRISTVVIWDIVVSARHRDEIVVVRAPSSASLAEVCEELVRDGDPVDAAGLRARVAQVVPPVDASSLRIVVHDAVTDGLVDIVTSLDELLVVDDGELVAAVEPLERAVEEAQRQAPGGRAGERYGEALEGLRRMHARTQTIVGGGLIRWLSIGAAIVVVPILVVGAMGENGPRFAWTSPAKWLLAIGLGLVGGQLSTWASPAAPSLARARAAGGRGPANWPRLDWVPGATGLLLILAAVLAASVS